MNKMVGQTFQIDNQALDFFEAYMRKERRRWEFDSNGNRDTVVRYSDGVRDIFGEVATLRHIGNHVTGVNLPTIRFRDRDSISLRYIVGVRGDTVLDALRSRASEASALRAASAFFSKMKQDLAEVQRIPVNPAISPKKYAVHEKLTRDALELVRIAPNTSIALDELKAELDDLSSDYEALCSRPFRDANPKNCVVRLPVQTNVVRARSDQTYLASTLEKLYGDDHTFFDANTFQLDFSGWDTLVPEFDDEVILYTHRSTIWLPRSTNEIPRLPWQDRDLLTTAFVRHFRLAIRRAFYQIVHANGYRIRYGHDPTIFYAGILNHVARAINKISANRYRNVAVLCAHLVRLAAHPFQCDHYEAKNGNNVTVYHDGFLEKLL